MNINTNSIVSITEANQNFSRVARMVDENGSAVILKNNTPRYVLLKFSQVEKQQTTPDEDVMSISRRILEENKEAYAVLAT
jgi:antitoxin Phd